jgi:argininosuccinate synthase
MPRYAELIYNGFWFSPEREMLQALIDKSQEHVDRHGAAEALQGQCHRPWAAGRRNRSIRKSSSPSRTIMGAYDQKDAPASSSSTRCACALTSPNTFTKVSR